MRTTYLNCCALTFPWEVSKFSCFTNSDIKFKWAEFSVSNLNSSFLHYMTDSASQLQLLAKAEYLLVLGCLADKQVITFSTATCQTIHWIFPFEKNVKGLFIVAEICCRHSQMCKQCRDISQTVRESKTFSKKRPLDSLTSWVLLQLSATYRHLNKPPPDKTRQLCFSLLISTL